MTTWMPIETAPGGQKIRLRTRRGRVVVAEWVGDSVVDANERPCGAWHADEPYPACWTDGICWAQNEDGKTSDQPVKWMPLPADEEMPPR